MARSYAWNTAQSSARVSTCITNVSGANELNCKPQTLPQELNCQSPLSTGVPVKCFSTINSKRIPQELTRMTFPKSAFRMESEEWKSHVMIMKQIHLLSLLGWERTPLELFITVWHSPSLIFQLKPTKYPRRYGEGGNENEQVHGLRLIVPEKLHQFLHTNGQVPSGMIIYARKHCHITACLIERQIKRALQRQQQQIYSLRPTAGFGLPLASVTRMPVLRQQLMLPFLLQKRALNVALRRIDSKQQEAWEKQAYLLVKSVGFLGYLEHSIGCLSFFHPG